MSNITAYRGVQIRQAEVPGATFEWTHDETDAHGVATTEAEARSQIDRHFGQESGEA